MSWAQVVNNAVIALVGLSGGLLVARYTRSNETHVWRRGRREGHYSQLVGSAMEIGTMMHVTVPLTLREGGSENEVSAGFVAAHEAYLDAQGACTIWASDEMTDAIEHLYRAISASMMANVAWVTSYRAAPDSPATAARWDELEAQIEPMQAATRRVIREARRELDIDSG